MVTLAAKTAVNSQIVQLSFFFLRRSFFDLPVAGPLIPVAAISDRATEQPNEVDRTNILAPGFVPACVGITFFPPSPSKILEDWPNWEVVSSYSSATAPDSHGISCADPLFQARKELDREVVACASRCKIFLPRSNKSPAQSDNGSVTRQRLFLLGEG
jgi:hypothetical protein